MSVLTMSPEFPASAFKRAHRGCVHKKKEKSRRKTKCLIECGQTHLLSLPMLEAACMFNFERQISGARKSSAKRAKTANNRNKMLATLNCTTLIS